ncbi:nucleoside transporter family protein, putative [Ichthyophthirius multifiliis]|uniref:Nucleoside transporter family protein, putative n=1 Tax=Ichthyophthirius multifiliis TaxID=5932 RepID=G0QYE7_ICHMU|nr:nucleoside transporter family protein, putative [Ichthyophthirius multifiliis]EGR29756.1 nucleoside transporter family protein, putative [Ichthyophthirius multifiliis]|eukprot:XP_004030992.1 nucleoside transporter family protein, putative [Ichthyophthirius multifiliis]
MTELVTEKIQIIQTNTQQSQQTTEDYEKMPSVTLFHKLSLAILGICSLTGWNAILNALDFFQEKFPKQQFLNVSFFIPIPIMCSSLIVGAILSVIGNAIPFQNYISIILRVSSLSVASLCLVSVFLKETYIGIVLVFIIQSFQGTVVSISNNCCLTLAMATQNSVLIGIYLTFTSLSGLIMNLLRLTALGTFGIEDLDKGTGLYFGVAAGSYITGRPAPFIIFVSCVQTSMLYPGVSVFQKPKYTYVKFPVAPILMVTIFNIGDIFGKSLGGGFKFLQKAQFAFGIVICRFIANLQGSQDMQNDFFQYFLIFMFALTKGLVSSILMTVGPQRATNSKDRDLISHMNILFLTLGVSVGSLMALILKINCFVQTFVNIPNFFQLQMLQFLNNKQFDLYFFNLILIF